MYGNGTLPPAGTSYPKIVTDLQQAIDQLRKAESDITAPQVHVPPSPEPLRGADPEFVRQAESICKGMFHMLCDKNRSYGNSALDPIRIFARAEAEEQINVRIDDKLSRVKFGAEYPGDDTVLDLIGYLILKLIANQRKAVS